MPEQIDYSNLHKELPQPVNNPNDRIARLPVVEYQLPKTVDLKNYQQFMASDAYKELGINPNLTQEEMTKQYDRAQSYGESISNSFGKFWNKTSNSFKDFFRADVDTITNLPNNFKDTINLFSGDRLTNSALMDHMYQELKDEEKYDTFHPNFDSRDDATKNSFLQWIPGFKGSGDNYEQFLPSLGYTVGMAGAAIVQEGLVTLATGGLGDAAEAEYAAYKGKKIYDLLTGFKLTNAKRALNALKTFNKGDKLVKGLIIGLEGLNMYSAFKSEAAMEAANTGTQTYDAINKEFIESHGYALTGKEKDQAQQEALRAANTDYLLNAPILLTSNFIQFSKLFMPVGARVIENLTEDALKDYKLVGRLGTATFEKEAGLASKLSEASNIPSKLKVGLQAGWQLIKNNRGTLSEGLEESLQRFASDYSQDYFTKQFKDKKDWNWDSMGKSIGYSLADVTSKAGFQEFIGGAVLGSLTHLVGTISDKTGASDKWAKFTGGKTKNEKELRNEKFRANILDLVNNSAIDFALKDEGFANLVKESLNSKELIHYNNEKDLFNAANAKYLGLYNMVWNAVKSGKTDFIISQLKDVANSTDKTELATKLNINPEDINHENLQSLVGSITDKIKETEKNFKSVQKDFTKLGIEKELVNNHNNAIKILINRTKDLAKKYNFDLDANLDIEPHWDKLSSEDKQLINQLGLDIEGAKLNLYAYHEGVKVAAINYQSIEDTSKRSNELLNQLNNNNSDLNYTESLQLLEKKNLRQLRKNVSTSLSLATEPSDKKIFQKQLDAIDKADKATNHEEMADAMHEYAKSSSDLLANSLNIAKHEIKSGYKQKLIDISKLQQQQRGNLDIYNFLSSPLNFKEYRNHTYNLLKDFFSKVYDWKEVLDKKEEVSTNTETKQETATSETPTSTNGTPVELSSSQQEQFNKIAERFPNFNIQITQDENGKHDIHVTYKSELFGKLPEDKTQEIKQDFKELLSDLDEQHLAKTKKKQNIQDLKTIIEKYNQKLDNLDTVNITPTTIDTIQNNFIEEVGTKMVPELQDEVATLINRFESFLTPELVYPVEGEEFIPENTLLNTLPTEEKKVTLDIVSGAKPFMTMLKTSSKEADSISKTEEALSKDSYNNFIRQFKDFLPSIQGSFLSVDMPEEHAEFRLVIRKDSADLQTKYQAQDSPYFGEVILVQTKDNGVWKDAYFDDNFNHFINKTNNNKLAVFSFTNPLNNKFDIDSAIEARDFKGISTPQESELHFSLEQEKLKELRQLAQIEDQPILLSDLSNGILLNSGKKTTSSEIIKKEHNPVIVIAAQKGVTNTLLGNQYVLNGSAHVKVGNKYIQLHPKVLSQEIIKEIDELLNHKFEHIPGTPLSKDILDTIKYLSTLIYTNPNLRYFTFNETTNQIELTKKATQDVNGETLSLTKSYPSIAKFVEDEPLILNVSKNRLSENKVLHIVNNKLTSTIKPVENYVQFILDNSDVHGEFETKNNIPSEVRVNKYLSFAQPIEKTNNSVSSEDTTTSNQSEIKAKKADIKDSWSKIGVEYGGTSTKEMNGYFNPFTNKVGVFKDTPDEIIKHELIHEFIHNMDKLKKIELYNKVDELLEKIDSIALSKDNPDNVDEFEQGISLTNAITYLYNDYASTNGTRGRNKEDYPYQEEFINHLLNFDTFHETTLYKILSNFALDNFKQDVDDILSQINLVEITDRFKEIKKLKEINDKLDALENKTETPKTNEDLSNGGFSNSDAFGEILSSKEAEENLIDYTYERMNPTEVEWIKQLAGKAGQKVLFQAANSDKWGSFTTAAITLFDAKVGTGYHEGWHTFSQMFLTKDQKLKLYDEVRSKVKELKNATPIQIEEYLADDFKKYVLSDGKLVLNKTPEKQNIFQKIYNFIKRLFTGNLDLEKLYKDLRHGDLYEYTPSISNAFWGHLNSAKGFENMPIDKLITYSKHADCVIGQILSTPLTVVSGKYQGTVITNLRSATEALKDPTIRSVVKNELLNKFQELNGTKKFNEDIKQILDNFDSFVEFNSEYSKSGFDLTEEEPHKYDEESLTKDTVYDKLANETSSFELGKEATKQLISLVPKCKWNGSSYEIVYDKNGLMTSADQKVLWTLLASKLQNSLLETDTLSKITDNKLQRKIPELGYIVDHLLPKGDNLNQQQKNVISQFHQSFSKVYVPIVTTVFKTNTEGQLEVFERYETKNNKAAIQQSALVNFFTLSPKTNFVKNGLVQKINGRNTLTDKFLSEKFDFSKNPEKIRFLNLLGFDVTLPQLIKEPLFQEIGKNLDLIDSSLKERIVAGQTITNPISDVSIKGYNVKEDKDIVSEKSNVNKVVEMISNVSLKNPSMSYRGANGQMKYGLQPFNKITQTNYWLSETPSYEAMVSVDGNGYNLDYLNSDKYHLTRGSLFLELSFGKTAQSTETSYPRLLDFNNNPIKIQIESYDGMESQDADAKASNQKSTSDLNYREKLLLDLNSLLINGRISMIQPASKRTYYSMRLSSYNKFSNLSEPNYISLESVINSENPYTISKFTNVYKNYLEAELFKVANKDYAKLNQDNFTLFDFLSDELKDTLKKKAKASKSSNYFDIIEKHSGSILSEMTSYFTNIEKELANEFAKYDISNKNLATSLQNKTEDFNKFIQNYVMNTYILGMEELKLFHADPTFYNKVKGENITSSFFKRAGQNISTGAIPDVSESFLNYHFNTQPFSFASVFGKTKSKEDFGKTTFQTIADQVVTNHPMLDKTIIPGTKITAPKLIVDVANSYKILQEGITGKPIEINQQLINELSKSFLNGNYNKINVTDGGGLSTLDFYKQILDAVGNWSTEHEYLYRALSIEFKLAKSKDLTEEQKSTLTKQMNNYFELAGDTVFNIIKLQANLITVVDGVPTPILHKFSVAPIFYSSVKGKQLEDIHDSMLKNGIDYLPFESASKAFTPNIHELITNGNLSLEDSKPTTIPLAGLKEQITTASKEKKDQTRGVQITQLTLSNLVHLGKPIDFAGTKEEFDNTPYDKLTPLGKIYRDNLSNLRELKKLNREGLYKELGLELQPDGNIHITNSEKLVKKLHQLAEQRQANSNIKTYISFDKATKDFSNPLEFALNRDEIKKLINGLLDRKLRVMKANGSQAIQMSDFGQQEKNHGFTNPTPDDLLKYGVNGLPFTHIDSKGNLVKMGCKITMTDNYKSLLNLPEVQELANTNNITPLEALNTLLKSPKFKKEYEESLSIVGYRIPTDGPSSMMLLDIHEFLPTYEGNKIILPAGVTTQSGTDYDIDKLSLFFKYLNHKGKVISSNFNKKDVFKSLKQLQEKSDELLFSLGQIQKSQDFNQNQINISSKEVEEINDIIKEITQEKVPDEEVIEKLENLLAHHEDVLSRYTKEILGNSDLAKEYIKEFEGIKQSIKGLQNQLDRKKQIENQIVKNYEETLSHPAMLYSMLKPNTVSNLESLSEDISKKTGVKITNFRNSELAKPLSSQKTHDELQEGKKALSIWAVGNTFFQNIAQTGLKLSNKIELKIGDESKILNIKNLLLSQEEENKYLDKDGNFNLSEITDTSGRLTKEVFSEAMNMCVDVEGNPFIKQLGHNLWNAPVAVYMTIKKVPIDRQWNFLNQPVLQHFYAELNKRGKDQKKSIIADIYNTYFKYLLKDGKSLDSKGATLFCQILNSTNKQKFDLFELEDDITKNPTAFLEVNKGLKNNIIKRQFNVFTHYIALEEEAKMLNNLRRNTNFLSRKIQGMLQANEYLREKDGLLKNPFFESSSIKNYYNSSIANTYNELPLFIAVSKRMFPINSDPVISSVFTLPGYTPDNGFGDLFKAKAEKIITNDIISTLYQNFGLQAKEVTEGDTVLLSNNKGVYMVYDIKDNKAQVVEINEKTPKTFTVDKSEIINLNRQTLFDKTKYAINVSDQFEELILNRLKEIKDAYPELEETFPIVGRFIPNISKKSSKWNIELFRADANETSDKDSYIQQLKALTHHENPEIANLFRDIMFTGLYQSGYNLSPLFFTDIMDYDVLMPVIHNANTIFNLMKDKSPELYHQFVLEMADNIKYNNPSLFKFKEEESFGVNFESFRGKNLSLDMNQVAQNALLSEAIKETPTQVVDSDKEVVKQPIQNKEGIDSNNKINIYAGTNENADLSNFAIRPFEIKGYKFNSVEQAFQEAKYEFTRRTAEDEQVRTNIQNAKSSSKVKSLGRKYQTLDAKAWDNKSSEIMKRIIKLSFEQNPKALEKLLATGSAELTHTQDKGKWGKEFPKLLMEVRGELRQQFTPKFVEQLIVKESNNNNDFDPSELFNEDENNSYDYQEDSTPDNQPQTIDNIGLTTEEREAIIDQIAKENNLSKDQAIKLVNQAFVELKDDQLGITLFIDDILKKCKLGI